MEHHLTLHIKNFNNRVQVMNQTGARELVLTKLDAQNLHSEIFSLLTHIAKLTERRAEQEQDAAVVNVEMDGGGF